MISQAVASDPGATGPAIRVVIAAEVPLYCEGVAHLLARASTLTVVATAGSGPELIQRVGGSQADVVLIDMAMSDSLRTVQEVLREFPELRVVGLGADDDERDLIRCAEVGVSGYVTQSASADDVLQAIQSAMRGEAIVSRRAVASLLERVAALALHRLPESGEPHLTPREFQIVRLIEEGLSNKEIGRRLCIELPTVKNHVHRIFEKLHVSRRAEAAAWLRVHPSRRP